LNKLFRRQSQVEPDWLYSDPGGDVSDSSPRIYPWALSRHKKTSNLEVPMHVPENKVGLAPGNWSTPQHYWSHWHTRDAKSGVSGILNIGRLGHVPFQRLNDHEPALNSNDLAKPCAIV
jgi:hypothetical protein